MKGWVVLERRLGPVDATGAPTYTLHRATVNRHRLMTCKAQGADPTQRERRSHRTLCCPLHRSAVPMGASYAGRSWGPTWRKRLPSWKWHVDAGWRKCCAQYIQQLLARSHGSRSAWTCWTCTRLRRIRSSACIGWRTSFMNEDFAAKECMMHALKDEDPNHAHIARNQQVFRGGPYNYLFAEHFFTTVPLTPKYKAKHGCSREQLWNDCIGAE